MSYCDDIHQFTTDEYALDCVYHATEYGFPAQDDRALFERLMLEINQAGLNWHLILKKRVDLREAYAHFEPSQVALFDEGDVKRLLQNERIIRHRLKICAAIYNAQQVLHLQKQYGSLKQWLDSLHPLSLDEWVKFFKQQFKFIGREIVHSFLLSTGYLKGAHELHCPVYNIVLSHRPPWSENQQYHDAEH